MSAHRLDVRRITTVAALLLLPACSSTVTGSAAYDPLGMGTGSGSYHVPDEHAEDIELIGDDGGDTDQLIKDSIADVEAYWADRSEAVFGEPPPVLAGGYYSVDTTDPQAAISKCADTPADVKNNAFYCPIDDSISVDKDYIARIADDYSDLDVAFTIAHEYGHALQFAFLDTTVRSIVIETQADCLTGAWGQSVEAGEATYFEFSQEDLEGVLSDYVTELGAIPGSDPNEDGAHGSVFDRVTAMQEGWFDGPESCVSNFSESRVFTQESFTTQSASTDGMGNLSLPQTLTSAQDALDYFWYTKSDVASQQPPSLTEQAPPGGCPDDYVISACADDERIYLADDDRVVAVHSDLGDYALVSAIALAYADYVQQTEDLDGGATAQICALGAFSTELADQALISPGDFDEAVRLLLLAGADNTFIDTGDTSAWDRIDALRTGVYQGLDACDL